MGVVSGVSSRVETEINPKETSLMVACEKIEYMVGFEDEDMILRNYAMTLSQ